LKACRRATASGPQHAQSTLILTRVCSIRSASALGSSPAATSARTSFSRSSSRAL
jgi:hypothetical protein